MPRDSESLKILSGVWASGPNADRTDPDDAGLNPTLNREVGWPASFSDGTDLPRREVFNQRFRELDGAARDAMVFGIPPWSADVDYPANEGLVQRQVSGQVQVFTNNAATGPGSTVVDPATEGQTTWEPIGGLDTRVAGVVAVAGDEQVVVRWGRLALSGLTGYRVQWKSGGQSYSVGRQRDVTATGALTATISPLSNGTEYDFRVAGIVGGVVQEYSADVSATPIAQFQRFTTSQASWSWPYAATRARVILKGGGSGSAGGGGGGAPQGGAETAGGSGPGDAGDGEAGSGSPGGGGGGGGGESGGAGGNTSVTVGGATHTASGGRRARGGGGGVGASTPGTGRAGDGGNGGGQPPALGIPALGSADDQALVVAGADAGNGAMGGATPGGNGTRGGRGEQSNEGDTETVTVTGLSSSSVFAITVGAGGTRGRGGDGGGATGSDGSDGSDGSGGWVEIHPI